MTVRLHLFRYFQMHHASRLATLQSIIDPIAQSSQLSLSDGSILCMDSLEIRTLQLCYGFGVPQQGSEMLNHVLSATLCCYHRSNTN